VLRKCNHYKSGAGANITDGGAGAVTGDAANGDTAMKDDGAVISNERARTMKVIQLYMSC
jgi:hypothetical protein